MDLPGEIELQDGVYEVGREEPADVVIPVPTVSGRHALLRISKSQYRPHTHLYAVACVRSGKGFFRIHVFACDCFCTLVKAHLHSMA